MRVRRNVALIGELAVARAPHLAVDGPRSPMCRTPSSRARRLLLVLGAAHMLASGIPSGGGVGAQQTDPRETQRPTFKVEINFVEIPAVVVDRQGRFVTDLSQGDFEVYEDGVRQVISDFRLVDLRGGPTDAQLVVKNAPEADVQTNATPFDGRLYVLLIDNLHIDFVDTAATRELARQFVDTQVRASDLAAIICTGGGVSASQDFTASQWLLMRAVEGCTGRAAGSMAQGSSGLPGRETSGVFEGRERDRDNRITLSAIRKIAESLAAVRGRRKALVLFSEGLSLGEAVGEDLIELADTISAANRANVSIYGLDPAGLKLAGGRADISPDIHGDPFTTGFQALETTARSRFETLRRLSLDTGGLIAVNTNLLGAALDRIGQDNSRYYLLGYYPPAPRRDGKFHRVTVKVGVPGAEVRARPGYLAPRPNATRSTEDEESAASKGALPLAVQEALDHALPVPAVQLTVCAAPFRSGAKSASVTVVVQVKGRNLRFQERKGRYDGGLRLVILAIDSEGRVKNSLTRTIGLPLRADRYTEVVTNGLRLVERLDVPRGRYRLRIAVQDEISQRVGSVHYDLDVPDFGALPLSMSGLVLTSSLAARVPSEPSQHLETFRPYLAGPPTVSRSFRPSEVLGVMAQVYDRDTGPHHVDIRTSVTDAAGREVYGREEQRSSAEPATNKDVHRYVTTVPLTGLTPGRYVLLLEATSRVTPERSARRTVPFEIAMADGPGRPRPGPVCPRASGAAR